MKSFVPNTAIQNDWFPLKKMELEGRPEASLVALKVLACFRDKNAS